MPKDNLKPIKYKPYKSKQSFYVIYDKEMGLYRTTASLQSRFAWTNLAAAAARFVERKTATEVIRGYRRGNDICKDKAEKTATPQEIIYPRPFPKKDCLPVWS